MVVATTLSSSERTRLESALAAVCKQAGVDSTGAELVRYTMNAVYRIHGAGVVVRMASGPNAMTLVSRVAQVAAAFADFDLPTTRLAPNMRQPIHADGWSATIWVLLPQSPGDRFEPVDLAAPLRAIHGVVGKLPFELPAWDPIGKVRGHLAEVEALDGTERDHVHDWADSQIGTPLKKIVDRLRQECDKLAGALSTVEWTLPPSVIHGDAHTGNLLRARDGQIVLCDLDSVGNGPPEWDLTPAAHGALRFGDDPARQAALARAYGLDVTTCPAWDVLRQGRELQLVTSVIANLPGRPDVADTLAHRLRSMLANDRSAVWHRYT